MAITSTLKNGDRVEVETKKNAKPSFKWIEYCKTTMARRKINQALENK
jgi:(p)ppGpp synthase/HD superfamily hydrolase